MGWVRQLKQADTQLKGLTVESDSLYGWKSGGLLLLQNVVRSPWSAGGPSQIYLMDLTWWVEICDSIRL